MALVGERRAAAGRLGSVVDAAPTHGEAPVPRFTGVGEQAAAAAQAGVVEQEMDVVGLVLLDDLVAEREDRLLRRDVAEVGGDPRVRRRFLGHRPGLVELVGGEVACGDVASGRDQLQHQLAPHAARATRDDRQFSVEVLHVPDHGTAPRSSSRPTIHPPAIHVCDKKSEDRVSNFLSQTWMEDPGWAVPGWAGLGCGGRWSGCDDRSMVRDILDEYAADIGRKPSYPNVTVEIGMVVEDRASHYCGDIVRWNVEAVTLRERGGHLRHFGWKPGGFLIDGKPVTLVRPATSQRRRNGSPRPGRSRATGGPESAQGSRIWVEGIHDAELIEHVWGDDLRELGLVVEPLHGADDLAAAVAEFAPTRDRRIGVLLDHLVPGSKETRIAQIVRDPNVLITGHPFVDVWAGIRPKVLGLTEWPDVPKGELSWKEGLCAALACRSRDSGRGCATRSTRSPTCVPSCVGAVEQLIDFVGE